MLHDKFPSTVKWEFEIDSEKHWCSKNVNLMKKTVTPGQECDVLKMSRGGKFDATRSCRIVETLSLKKHLF